MSTNLDKLLRKRAQLEQQIIEAQTIKKRKTRVQQIVFAELEKHDELMLATDQILRENLELAFSKIAQNLSARPTEK
jgi:hypothetical protein